MSDPSTERGQFPPRDGGTFSIFGDDIHFAQLHYEYSHATLFRMKLHAQLPEKLQAAVPLRQIDFLAGRLCAHQALRGAGCSDQQCIQIGKSGEPIWPADYVGAISHCAGWAIAAAGHKLNIRAIGVDTEEIMDPEVAEQIQGQIANPEEILLGKQQLLPFEIWLTLIFSAKESLFKALFPDVGRYFDFLDATARRLDTENGTLTLTLIKTLSETHRQGIAYEIRFQRLSSRVLTSCILRE